MSSNPTKPARTAGQVRIGDAGHTPLLRLGRADAAHLAACWNLVESYGGDPEALRRALEAAIAWRRTPLRTFSEIEDLYAALDALGRRG